MGGCRRKRREEEESRVVKPDLKPEFKQEIHVTTKTRATDLRTAACIYSSRSPDRVHREQCGIGFPEPKC